MKPPAPIRFLYQAAAAGFALFVVGVCLGVVAEELWLRLIAVALEALGAAVLFPVLISFVYDALRERWLGDEVWRIFGELADAGISRVYKDREASSSDDNAQTRLAEDFRNLEDGSVQMIGVSLRVFFNPLGPFYRDIATMLRNGAGRIHIRALIAASDSPEAIERAAIEEPSRAPEAKPQIERDIDSTIATARSMVQTLHSDIVLRQYSQAPYCTAIIFPHVAFYSPNLLAPEAPVRLPMMVFRHGSHGYDMIKSSFDHLWSHPATREVSLTSGPTDDAV